MMDELHLYPETSWVRIWASVQFVRAIAQKLMKFVANLWIILQGAARGKFSLIRRRDRFVPPSETKIRHNHAVKLQSKIFLQFFSAWLLMPVGLGVAQWSGIAQLPEFIAAILLVASVGPIQIYVNEIFAPIAVREGRGLPVARFVEVSVGIAILALWACYRLQLNISDYLYSVMAMLGFVWCSFGTAKRVLMLQATSVIGGLYSFTVGSLPSLVFLALVIVFWILQGQDLLPHSALYALVLLPTLVQYLYARLKWADEYQLTDESCQISKSSKFGSRYLMIALLLAFISQQWKIELVALAAGFAALSIYMISPVSSLWLIYSKSRYIELSDASPVLGLWLGPFIVLSTTLLTPEIWWMVFLLALLAQALTFKFITDVRIRLSDRGAA